jgi:hypothetical protein
MAYSSTAIASWPSTSAGASHHLAASRAEYPFGAAWTESRRPSLAHIAGRSALCQALPGQREIRARPHRGRWAPASSGGAAGRLSLHGSRRGLAAAGEDIKLTRPGKSHPIVMLPWVVTGPPVRRMTWTAAVQPALLQSAASVGKSKASAQTGAWFPRYLSCRYLSCALRRQCRYFLAKELADHPDHGRCGWVKRYARADRGTDTAPEKCDHGLAGDLTM